MDLRSELITMITRARTISEFRKNKLKYAKNSDEYSYIIYILGEAVLEDKLEMMNMIIAFDEYFKRNYGRKAIHDEILDEIVMIMSSFTKINQDWGFKRNKQNLHANMTKKQRQDWAFELNERRK